MSHRRPSGTPAKSIARIRIADNGVGIDEADIASIFQIFASTKGSRGTGLGLPVSQKIIREHGGRIVVTSQPGQGSTFIHRAAHDPRVRTQGHGRGANDDGLNRQPGPHSGKWLPVQVS